MTISKNHKTILLSALLFIINACVYCLFMLSLKAVDMGRSAEVNALYTAIIVVNSLLLPCIIFAVIFYFRNIVIATVLQVSFLLLVIVISLYFEYFHSVPHISLIQQMYVLPSVTEHIAKQLVGIHQLLYLSLIPVLIWLLKALNKDLSEIHISQKAKKRIAVLLIFIFVGYVTKAVFLNQKTPISESIKFDTVAALKKHGISVLYTYELFNSVFKTPKEVLWPGKINDNAKRVEIAEERKKKNVILIQVESMDAHFFDFQIGSKHVMPHMHEWKKKGLYFSNFFAHHRGGATLDAELTTLTSLLPLNSHPGFITADYNKITSLNQVLSANGYATLALHANVGTYFNRFLTYSMLGFDQFLDQDAYTGEAKGRYSKDKLFFEQSFTILENVKEPFFAYLITMQLHGPYENHSQDKNVFDFKATRDSLERNYLLSLHEVDQALDYVLSELDRRGFLNDSIVFIFGDHESGLRWEEFDEERICPAKASCRIPLLVLGKDVAPSINNKVSSPLDLAPTILDYLGIAEPEGWLGESLLHDTPGTVVLNYGKPFVLKNSEQGVVREEKLKMYEPFIEYSESILDAK